MIYGANNDSCEKDSHSSSYSNLEDDSLMSLFAFPLPSLDQFDSFEYPFDDPSMEPLPLGSQAQVPALVHSSSDSNVMNESSSKKGPTGSTNSLVQDLINILNPLTSQTVVSKRSIEEAFFADDQVRGNKRQRTTCPMQAASRTPQEESTPRFRPYQETQWRAQFQKLVQYKLEHGHCSVPHAYPEDPILARWVKRQRYQYKKFNDNSPTSTMTTRPSKTSKLSVSYGTLKRWLGRKSSMSSESSSSKKAIATSRLTTHRMPLCQLG
ncbi:unnamed protein product [Cylindrotheca closterium]|uniref:Helicase-associated domain-containing protein n=1 Tax=Cylindrotheca closterium TaxID=2856 RepID=A0AAD2FJP0_9STRA|nr:unnamed protein product [Cylindrotheca closterium]